MADNYLEKKYEDLQARVQDEKNDGIIHLAAESHVDRSIKDPFTFARTNVMGTLSLLQAAKLYWEQFGYVMPQTGSDEGIPCRFYHISTDEVYGALSMNHPEGIEPQFKTVDKILGNPEGHSLEHQEWMDNITSGEYEKYYNEMYSKS